MQKQDQVWFNKISTHKGVGTVQSLPNPLKHGNEVTTPLYEILHMHQDRFQRRSDLTTLWSRTKIIFIVQPRNSCDIHLQKPRCISDRSSTWTQMKIMMNTTFWSILKNTTTLWSMNTTFWSIRDQSFSIKHTFAKKKRKTPKKCLKL